MGELIEPHTQPIPFICESCGANLWEMIIRDIPKQVILIFQGMVGSDICGAEISMEI